MLTNVKFTVIIHTRAVSPLWFPSAVASLSSRSNLFNENVLTPLIKYYWHFYKEFRPLQGNYCSGLAKSLSFSHLETFEHDEHWTVFRMVTMWICFFSSCSLLQLQLKSLQLKSELQILSLWHLSGRDLLRKEGKFPAVVELVVGLH